MLRRLFSVLSALPLLPCVADRVKQATHVILIAAVAVLAPLAHGCASSGTRYESARTEKLLGVPVIDFPAPPGPSHFDELPADAAPFAFDLSERPLSGPQPRAWYEPRKTVSALAPDGSVFEAYCGDDDPNVLSPGHGFVSTLDNRRQPYGTMYFVAQYYPDDIYVGKRDGGRLRPTLFFRDVGSHNDAPHALAVDSRGRCHLMVADVNIYRDNRLDLYWVVGNPQTGKWTAAYLIDRRGFTSWSRPWSTARGDDVHLLWSWADATTGGDSSESGIFHVARSAGQFDRKVRIAKGVISGWDAATDRASGRLLVAFSTEDGVYVVSSPRGERWTRPAKLQIAAHANADVSVAPLASGAFLIRVGSKAVEWLVRPI